MRWVKPKLVRAGWHITAISVCCTVSSLMGCSAAEQPKAAEEKAAVAELGSVNLALTGASSSGAVYRLRNALFQIISAYGNYETYVNTEDDPESTFLYLEVPQGEYYVYLLPGYTVEQVSGGSGGVGGGSGGMGPIAVDAGSATPGPAPTTSSEETRPATQNRWKVGTAGKSRKVGAARQSSYEQPEPMPYEAGIPQASDDSDTSDDTDTSDETIDYSDDTDTTDTIDYSDEFPTVEQDGGAAGGDEVEAQLISENPAYVYVEAYQVSQVRFSFLVNGDTVNTDPRGGLIIGADFYEEGEGGGSCEGDDPYEPNDFDSPVYVETAYPLYAYMCSSDSDMYLFDAPVPEGEFFTIEVTFDSSLVDIDIEYGTADYEFLGYSDGIDDTETLMVTSNGGSYLLHVYPFSGESAPYQVTFNTVFEASNSCCEASDEPYCSDSAVMACVCTIDAECCNGSYDELCVQQAAAECGAQCEVPEPTSTCCGAAAEPGCLDETVEACVCDIDPTCCTTSFDQNCANLAQGQCGAVCGGADQ